MSTISALRGLFIRKMKDQRASDSDLAVLARHALLECVGKKEGAAYVCQATQENKDIANMAKEALSLLRIWDESDVTTPLTLRVLLDALLKGWANTFIDSTLEKEIAGALLVLRDLSDNETSQLEEVLRQCGKEYLRYQPQKLLRILADVTDEHNKVVVRWAATTLARMIPAGHLRFVAQCLLGCGSQNDWPPQLEWAARHHIEAAAKTLEAAKKLHFADVRGGPYQPMDGKLLVRTSTLVDYVWVTSNMGGVLKESTKSTKQWLDLAERQVLEQLGSGEKRGFAIDLIVKIYPHDTNWYARRDELKVLEIVSRTV